MLRPFLGLALLLLMTAPMADAQQPVPRAALRGDVDGDGRVTAADAQAVRDHVAGRPAQPGWALLPNGDANGDGRITGVDAAILQAAAAGRDVSRFAIGKPIQGNAPAAGSGSLTVLLECTVDVDAGTHSCQSVRPRGAARQDIIMGKPYIAYSTTGSASSRGDPANEDSVTMNVALVNQIAQPIGTTDGLTAASSGNRVFFHDGPRVTVVKVGTLTDETARIDNTDGIANFTSPDSTFVKNDKRYFQYDGVLAKNDTSAARLWRFVFSANTRTFTYSVLVSAPVQFEWGRISITAPPPAVAVGDTVSAPAATVYDITGAPVTEAIVWTSSDSTVAKVDPATGRVTGMAQGSATVTATSAVQARRKGTYQIQVTATVAVPAFAPDTVPESIYADTNVVWQSATLPAPFLRDVVVILFKPNASASERQSAVNLTGGTVIGGRRMNGNDGFYLVRVETGGTTSALEQAIARIDTLPQVEYAGVERVSKPEDISATVKPEDGAGFQRTDWTLRADSASGANWGLEAIEAPKAWSCTVGDAATAIAIVDEGFIQNPEFSAVNDPSEWTEPPPPPQQQLTHGNEVASIASATGGNSMGMAGVIWNAQRKHYTFLKSYRIRRLLGNTEWGGAIGAAIRGHARVINISSQTAYYDSAGNRRAPNPNSAGDIAIAQEGAKMLLAVVRWNLFFGGDPLLVISAGNYLVDSRLNGFTWLADPAFAGPISGRTVVVAAAQRTGSMGTGTAFGWGYFDPSLQTGSNYGTNVTLAAPGVGVGYLSTGSMQVNSTKAGTSYAAPMVSGAAALLVSLDPRLTAAELKARLVSGAVAGNRTIAAPTGPAVPLLNAYESLRIVAERSGAGLCGNPVWQDTTGKVFTKRGAGFQGAVEELFLGPKPGSGSGMSVQHSTGSIRFTGGSAHYWKDGQWRAGIDGSTSDNASILSRVGRSHEGDTTVSVSKRPGADPARQELFDIKVNGVVVRTVDGPGIHIPTNNPRCVKWETWGTEYTNGACVSQYNTFPKKILTSEFSVSYNSAAQEVYLSVARDSLAQSVNDLQFYYDAGYYNRDSYYSTKTHDTYVYAIPLDGTKPVRTFVYSGDAIRGLTFSEGGEYVVMQRSFFARTDTYASTQTYSASSSTCGASDLPPGS